jgi:AcrR family transcriptional regulator
MARVNLVRRAQIGQRRRAKSHAHLIRAARALFAIRPVDSITVDDVTKEAKLAKGTFYVHFQHLDDLRSAVADELARELDDLIQPHRTAIADPVERIATGCAAFIRQALCDPAWGGLAARGVWALPAVAAAARARLNEDLRAAIAQGRIAKISAEVGFDIAVGIVLQAMRSASQKRLPCSDVAAVVSGVLRGLGVAADETDQIVRRLPKPSYLTNSTKRSPIATSADRSSNPSKKDLKTWLPT